MAQRAQRAQSAGEKVASLKVMLLVEVVEALVWEASRRGAGAYRVLFLPQVLKAQEFRLNFGVRAS